MTMKLVTAEEMRALEASAFAAGTSAETLMENAGRAIASTVRGHLGDARARRVVVLVGPGNNGGDGLVAARHLHDFGGDVKVFLFAPRDESDPNLKLVIEREIEVVQAQVGDAGLADAMRRADAVIDAVLGTGRQRPLDGPIAWVFGQLKDRRAMLFSVDLPTGLDADTGTLDPHVVATDVTLALGYSKLGLHLWPGSAHAGEVDVLDIGLDPSLESSIPTQLLTPSWAREVLPPRPPVSNKGTFGRVLVVAGSGSYIGAATLACLGALRAGAGLVTLASVVSVRGAVAANLPEVTFLPLPEEDGEPSSDAGDAIARVLLDYDALLIGPGLGLAATTQAMVRGLLSSPAVASIPAVIDADALNALSRQAGWSDEMKCEAVLTPHPGELARLTGSGVADVQAARLSMVRERAAAWRQTVVLKGANTVIARPDGQALVSPFANALLATAGTGDILAGTIAGLLAQEVDRFAAAGLGVYLNAAAAESLTDSYGESGLLASELGPAIARTAAQLRRGE
jgi:NAD(P)H-hydrate epimerase